MSVQEKQISQTEYRCRHMLRHQKLVQCRFPVRPWGCLWDGVLDGSSAWIAIDISVGEQLEAQCGKKIGHQLTVPLESQLICQIRKRVEIQLQNECTTK